jgi:urea transport system substrate-binding protein
VPPIREVRPDVPQGVVAIVERMLAKKPAQRFSTPAEVAAALEPWATMLAGSPSSANRTLPASAASAAGKRSARRVAIGAGLAGLLLLSGISTLWFLRHSGAKAPSLLANRPIRVGVLHSRTGTMAISEKPVIDATLFAIEELNAKGGVLGRPVEAVVEDGASDWPTFAQKAEKLIAADQVCTIFGCWTSASRKAVKPVVEKHDHLLFYPVQYEGLEQSPNIVYTGAAPNQQIIPAVKWSCSYLKKRRLLLVGSDYVFPRAANAIIRDYASEAKAEIVGEEYVPLGSTDMAAAIAKIQARKPDLILNTINGDSNIAFFRALRKAGLTAAKLPTMSFSISEEELSSLRASEIQGDFAACNYFQSIDSSENQDFVRRFREHFGPDRIVSDPMEAAYIAVHLWARVVESAGTDGAHAIRLAINDQGFDAPEGRLSIDPQTHHISKFIRIGRIGEDGRFAVVYCSEAPIAPLPYPATRSKGEWDTMLADLHLLWGGQWANPNP